MKWLEIIELRSAAVRWDSIESQIHLMIQELNKKAENCSLEAYSRAMIENDFSIHLIHNSASIEKNGSTLGLHLASVLREFGIVNHSVWSELK